VELEITYGYLAMKHKVLKDPFYMTASGDEPAAKVGFTKIMFEHMACSPPFVQSPLNNVDV
jgi:hypothetical protein